MALPQDSPIVGEIRKAHEELKICQGFENFMKTETWTEVLEPWLRVNIVGQVGGWDKETGSWEGGRIQNYKDKEKIQECLTRKQDMMDVYNFFTNHVNKIPVIEERIRNLVKQKKELEKHPTMGYNYNA